DLPFAVVAVGPRHGPPMARGGHDLLSVVEPDPVAVLANVDRRDPSHLHRSTIAPEDFIAGRQIADSLEPLGGRDGRVQGEWLRLRGSGNLDEGHIYRFPYNPTGRLRTEIIDTQGSGELRQRQNRGERALARPFRQSPHPVMEQPVAVLLDRVRPQQSR